MKEQSVQIDIHNRFDVEVIDSKTGKVKERAKALNVVCNHTWSLLVGNRDFAYNNVQYNYGFSRVIRYGSGSGTPSASDTALFHDEGGSEASDVSFETDNTNKVIKRVCKIVLALSDAVGKTITEVGLSNAYSVSNLLTTHAMLQDMNGNPITITKTDTDIINIYATVYAHWNITDPSCAFSPTSGHDPAWISVLTGKTMLSDFIMGVSIVNHRPVNTKTCSRSGDAANKRVTYSVPRYTETQGNISGIKYLVGAGNISGISIKKGNNSWGAFQVQGETIGIGDGVTTEFNTKFHGPYNSTVYVNGVAVSNNDVTVKQIPCGTEAECSYVDNNSTVNNIIYLPMGEDSWYPKMRSNSGAPGSDDWNYYTFYNEAYDAGDEISRVYFSIITSYSIQNLYAGVSGSNDGIEWTDLGQGSNGGSSGGSVNIYPSTTYRFYRIRLSEYNSNGWCKVIFYRTGGNIIFNNPPINGDIITADYLTDHIPKDSDHVLDFSVTLQFGDYQGA